MKEFKLLFLGDVIGAAGLRALVSMAPGLRRELGFDALVVNGENAADGFGLTPAILSQMRDAGVDVVTSGNHIWHYPDIFPALDNDPFLLRPANYPPGNPGKGVAVLDIRGLKLGVVNLQGRTRMWSIDCPLRKGRELVRKLRQETPLIMVDIHAEAPEEKEALAFHLDSQVSLVAGTHTHVQTMDERILPGGCGYITDVGASGPFGSIIGFDPDTGIRRNLTQLPLKGEVSNNPACLCGILATLDPHSGRCLALQRISRQSAY